MTPRRGGALALLGALALALPAAAGAIPPTGPREDPGDPPAAASLAATEVASDGALELRGTGFLTASGAPQRVYVKVDDAGEAGIGPFAARADGTLAASVPLDDPRIPAGTLAAAGPHVLRVLAGPSGRYPDNGPPRSLRLAFRIRGAAGAAVPRPVRTALRVRGARVALRLRAGDGAARGTARVRPRGGGAVLARGAYAVAAGATRTVSLGLTPAGRRALRTPRRRAARLILAPAGGEPTAQPISIRGIR